MKFNLFSHSYSATVRIFTFAALAIFLILITSITAIYSLKETSQLLLNLRSRSLNQMLITTDLGVKTSQISTYAIRLTKTISALDYKNEAKNLKEKAAYLHKIMHQLNTSLPEDTIKAQEIAANIKELIKNINLLLEMAHTTHITKTKLLSLEHQALLHITHIKRLARKYGAPKGFIYHLNGIEKNLSEITKINPTPELIKNAIDSLKYLPEPKDYTKIKIELDAIKQNLNSSYQLTLQLEKSHNQGLFNTYNIQNLVTNIDQIYTKFIQKKIINLKQESSNAQAKLNQQISLIATFSAIAILLVIALGYIFYKTLGKRLHSVTQALKRLADGKNCIKVPEQMARDEIGELARAFHIFYENNLKLIRTDAQLKEQNKLLEKTFLAMRDGFAIFNPKQKLISYNNEFINMLDTKQSKIIMGMKLTDLIYFLRNNEAKNYQTRTIISFEELSSIIYSENTIELIYKNLILECRITTLPDDSTAVLLIDRTRTKLIESNLVQSQKLRAMGHLTGGIAHDFNNLLAIIIGNLDLINPNDLEIKQQRRLNRAIQAANTSSTLTQRLLSYSRKQPLKPSCIDINKIVTNIVDLMKHSIPAAIEIDLHLDNELPLAFIDINQLETALMNLIVNAKDALNGIGHISIITKAFTVKRTYRDEFMVQITIKDNGCGMSQETQDKVFEPFFTTKAEGKGSGLGLSMVYGFIRQSGGRVKIDSRLQQGTTILLQLPIAKGNKIHNNKQNTIKIQPNIFNLLLIEDRAELRDTIAEQLDKLGFNITTCNCGEEAFKELNTTEFDFLISDITLTTEISGIDIADYALEYQPKIKILLITGNQNIEEIQKDEIKHKILNKPFTIEKLNNSLVELL